jgi:glycerophosphoryl diester phosphodiesterase
MAREDNPRPMEHFPRAATRVIGHRGSPRRAIENTFESFDWAEADGADGFELDVRLTLDGEAVVHHDPDVVVGDRRIPLASLALVELLELDLGNGARVPTLRDVLFRYGAQDLLLFVEMKPCPTPRAGLLENRVAALLSEMNLFSRSVVLSFSPDMLRRVKELEPRLTTSLNFDASAYRAPGRFLPELPKGCGAVGAHVAVAIPELFAEAEAAGVQVHVWTVNEPSRAATLAELGAASVITDVPAEVGPAVRAVTGVKARLDFAETGPAESR